MHSYFAPTIIDLVRALHVLGRKINVEENVGDVVLRQDIINALTDPELLALLMKHALEPLSIRRYFTEVELVIPLTFGKAGALVAIPLVHSRGEVYPWLSDLAAVERLALAQAIAETVLNQGIFSITRVRANSTRIPVGAIIGLGEYGKDSEKLERLGILEDLNSLVSGLEDLFHILLKYCPRLEFHVAPIVSGGMFGFAPFELAQYLSGTYRKVLDSLHQVATGFKPPSGVNIVPLCVCLLPESTGKRLYYTLVLVYNPLTREGTLFRLPRPIAVEAGLREPMVKPEESLELALEARKIWSRTF